MYFVVFIGFVVVIGYSADTVTTAIDESKRSRNKVDNHQQKMLDTVVHFEKETKITTDFAKADNRKKLKEKHEKVNDSYMFRVFDSR